MQSRPALNGHEPREDDLFVQFVLVELQTINELLNRPLRFERQERETECDVSPLTRFFREPETLAEFLDDVLRLLFLHMLLESEIPGKGRHMPFL